MRNEALIGALAGPGAECVRVLECSIGWAGQECLTSISASNIGIRFPSVITRIVVRRSPADEELNTQARGRLLEGDVLDAVDQVDV